jgi:NitT/TauT family transport system ATP-binding protein
MTSKVRDSKPGADAQKQHSGPVMSIADVSHTYESASGEPVLALDSVSLDIQSNEFVTIVGPSGCGKSTLLKLVAGLMKPNEGQITIAGTPLTRTRRDVQLVFQAATLLEWRDAFANVMLPVECMKLDPAEYREEARALLRLAGLEGFEHRYPRELSIGMQQRVGICRALVTDPQILLMDEPFGALDALTRDEMSLELLRIWSERQKTVLFVTHSIPEAVLLGDRVVVMSPRPGRIQEIVDVPLPRPRTLATEGSEQFGRLATHIRELIFNQRREPK